MFSKTVTLHFIQVSGITLKPDSLPTRLSRLRLENFDLTLTHAYGSNFSRLVEKFELLQPN